LFRRRKETLEILKEKLKYETSHQFYRCSTGCHKETFTNAFDLDFICPLCGKVLDYFDNSFIVAELKDYIEKLELFLKKHKKLEVEIVELGYGKLTCRGVM
jgi:transcription initiation factor TFIIE subunit alpha